MIDEEGGDMQDTPLPRREPRPSGMSPIPPHVVLAGQVLLGILVVAGAIWFMLVITDLIHERTVPEHFTIIRPPHEVSALVIDGDSVWAGGKDGLFLFDRTDCKPLPLPPGAPRFSYIRDLYQDRSQTLWIAHDGGIARYSNGSWDLFSRQSGAPFGRALSILEISDHDLWIGTEQAIFSWNGHDWHEISFPEGISFASADVLFRSKDGAVWVGCASPTRGGLLRYDGSGWRSYSRSDGLPHASVNGIAEDQNGTVWVATGFASQGGAALFKDGAWSAITQTDGLAGGCTRSVYIDQEGRIWVGSEYDGIAILHGSIWTILAQKDGLAGNEVKEMVQDEDGVYWLGTDRGLTVINTISPFLLQQGSDRPSS